jgi:hypothetical protein
VSAGRDRDGERSDFSGFSLWARKRRASEIVRRYLFLKFSNVPLDANRFWR